MLSLTDISIRIAGKLLIDHGSAQLVPGARVGILGRDGVVQSQPFTAIRGEFPTDTGPHALPHTLPPATPPHRGSRRLPPKREAPPYTLLKSRSMDVNGASGQAVHCRRLWPLRWHCSWT